MRMLDVSVLGYVLGSIPFGLLLTRAAGLGDIRRIGSGNIGATNVLRTGHRTLALATLLLDGGKGATAALLGLLLGRTPVGMAAGGLAAVLGHLFPAWLGFRGGKGVATGFGVLIACSPLAGLGAAAVWVGVAAATRISSAGALAAFVVGPLFAWAAGEPGIILWMAISVGVLVWARHHANIRRLIAGKEPKIGQRA